MERRRFTAEFKREAVRQAQQPGVSQGEGGAGAGSECEHAGAVGAAVQLRKWEATPGKPLKSEQQLEIERLRRELAKAQTERDILKKAVAYFAKEPK